MMLQQVEKAIHTDQKRTEGTRKTLKKSDRWIFYHIWCAGNYTERSFIKLLEDLRDFKLQRNLSKYKKNKAIAK